MSWIELVVVVVDFCWSTTTLHGRELDLLETCAGSGLAADVVRQAYLAKTNLQFLNYQSRRILSSIPLALF